MEKARCTECGKTYGDNYLAGPVATKMKEEGMCFKCAYWLVLVEENRENPLWFRIEGVSYVAESVLDEGRKSVREWGKGFGGAEFHIHLEDGSKVRTDNLWCQGKMPSWMKVQWPDNAKFTTDMRYSWRKGQVTKKAGSKAAKMLKGYL